MKRAWHFLSVILLVGVVASVCWGDTVHVPLDYSTIQEAIDAASNGDTVLVAPGIYRGSGNRDIDFCGKGILLMSEGGPDDTVIDCEADSLDPHRAFCFHSGEDLDSEVRGFAIRSGYSSDYGGGIYCDNSSPTIQGNEIRGNVAQHGGGIACRSASPLIVGNVIVSNSTVEAIGTSGGGIYCRYSDPQIEGNLISENGSYHGAGVYCLEGSGWIVHNSIVDNIAGGAGGGVNCQWASPMIEDNAIVGNTAAFSGGGVYGFVSPFVMRGNVVVANESLVEGGGVSCSVDYQSCAPAELSGNTLVANTAGTKGGGVFCYNDDIILWRNTIASNYCSGVGGGFYSWASDPVLTNCIVWGNTPDAIQIEWGTGAYVTYCDVEGGWAGATNIEEDPMFVHLEHRDCRLLWHSPCIDAGLPDSLDPDGTRSDMGAHYFDQSTAVRLYLTPSTTLLASGEDFGVTYSLMNISVEPMEVWARSGVILPNGNQYHGNPIVGPLRVTLPAETVIQRDTVHVVPYSAPIGSWSYWAQVGTYPPPELLDADSFEFQVTAR